MAKPPNIIIMYAHEIDNVAPLNWNNMSLYREVALLPSSEM